MIGLSGKTIWIMANKNLHRVRHPAVLMMAYGFQMVLSFKRPRQLNC